MSADDRVTTLPQPDDSGEGLAMFVIFSAAALFVTGAVALIALVGSWWMLGVAFAIHILMTSIVTFAVIHAMNGRPRRLGDDDPQARAVPGSRGLTAIPPTTF